MPAYLRPLVRSQCPDCPKRATHAVYNGLNALMGEYCEKHAEAEVERLNEHLDHVHVKPTGTG